MRQLDPREVVAKWAYYEPKIRNVLEISRAGQFPIDVLTGIQLGSMQLWDFNDGQAFCVTEIQCFSRYNQLLIFLVGGAYAPDWYATGCQHLEAFARLNDCAYLAFIGRPGWQKYAEATGFKSKQISMRKQLS